MERVSVIQGTKPVIFVAPHGNPANDLNTDIIAEAAAKCINAYAVINRGWKRSRRVDVFNDFANCNNIRHCLEDVVNDEFLSPILRFTRKISKTSNELKFNPVAIFKNKITKKYDSELYKRGNVYVFNLHGVGAQIRDKYQHLGFIVGNGDGTPPSFTSPNWMKYALMYVLETFYYSYSAEAGSPYAGWSANNMNQLFRKYYNIPRVLSMQLEVVHQLRNTPMKAELIGETIGCCVEELLSFERFDMTQTRRDFLIRRI